MSITFTTPLVTQNSIRKLSCNILVFLNDDDNGDDDENYEYYMHTLPTIEIFMVKKKNSLLEKKQTHQEYVRREG